MKADISERIRTASELVGRRFHLVGRGAVVVGGSSGIGFAIARGFAQAGADVAIVGRAQERLDAACAELLEHGGAVYPIRADIAEAGQRGTIIPSAADSLGEIGILVNCASAKPSSRSDVLERERPVLAELWEANVQAYFDLSVGAAQRMKRQNWGRIINVSSAIGMKPRRGVGEYGITKAAELMMSRVFSRELGEHDITVNSLVPILTRTDFSAAALANDAAVQEVLDLQSLKRIAEPEDLVGAALLLASDAGRFMTGTTLVVDGGASA